MLCRSIARKCRGAAKSSESELTRFVANQAQPAAVSSTSASVVKASSAKGSASFDRTGRNPFWWFSIVTISTAAVFIPYNLWFDRVKRPAMWRAMRDAMFPPPRRRTAVFVAGTADAVVDRIVQGKPLWFYLGVVHRVVSLVIHAIPILLHFAFTFVRGTPTAFDVNAAILQFFQQMGPTFVKLGQWIASRPDIFPQDLCKTLSKLFDAAPPHEWEHTEAALRRAGVLRQLSSIEKVPLNSGSVAQVHRATLRSDSEPEQHISELQSRTASSANQEVTVVVKVLHPGIEETMLTDLVAMNWFVRLLHVVPGVEFFSLRQNFDEFSSLLLSQLDLEREADNLMQFLHNFRFSKHIVFPIPLIDMSNKEVLVESYEVGTPLHEVKPNPVLAKHGCKMFMQMLFRDNFTHADLHPGNIMVRFRRKADGELFAKPPGVVSKLNSLTEISSRHHSDRQAALRQARVGGFGRGGGGDDDTEEPTREERFALGDQRFDQMYDPQLVILDPGLITTLSERERNNFIALFTAVACGNGDLGAKLMLERSPAHQCVNVEKFKADMREIFDAVGPKTGAGFSLANVDIGRTLTKIFETMREHRVRIDGNFASLVATVLVGEGLGRKMHPEYNIFAEATPWLVRELRGHELEHLVGELQQAYGVREVVTFGASAALHA